VAEGRMAFSLDVPRFMRGIQHSVILNAVKDLLLLY
jgi:hypothetical protein